MSAQALQRRSKTARRGGTTESFYLTFENRFRGSRELILGRLQAYLPFVRSIAREGDAQALDLGCGRGEWLELLGGEGIAARGVDLDEGMLTEARARGLDVVNQDAIAALKDVPNGMLAIVSGFHIAEHLSFEILLELIVEARRALRPGGLLILETPNAENITVATNSFYLDPTHVAPVPAMRLGFMADYVGFSRHVVLRLNGPDPATERAALVPLLSVFTDVSVDYGVVAQVEGPNTGAYDELFERVVGVQLSTAVIRFDEAIVRRFETVDEQLRSSTLAVDERFAMLDEQLRSSALAVDERFAMLDEQLRSSVLVMDERLQQNTVAIDERLQRSTAVIADELRRSVMAAEEQVAAARFSLARTRIELASEIKRLNEVIDARLANLDGLVMTRATTVEELLAARLKSMEELVTVRTAEISLGNLVRRSIRHRPRLHATLRHVLRGLRLLRALVGKLRGTGRPRPPDPPVPAPAPPNVPDPASSRVGPEPTQHPRRAGLIGRLTDSYRSKMGG